MCALKVKPTWSREALTWLHFMGLNPISRIALLSEQLARLRGAWTKNFAIKLLVNSRRCCLQNFVRSFFKTVVSGSGPAVAIKNFCCKVLLSSNCCARQVNANETWTHRLVVLLFYGQRSNQIILPGPQHCTIWFYLHCHLAFLGAYETIRSSPILSQLEVSLCQLQMIFQHTARRCLSLT